MKYTTQELQEMVSDPEATRPAREARTPATKHPSMPEGVKCRAKCAGGNDCLCNAKFRHQLHICKDLNCLCHSKAYLDSKRKVNS